MESGRERESRGGVREKDDDRERESRSGWKDGRKKFLSSTLQMLWALDRGKEKIQPVPRILFKTHTHGKSAARCVTVRAQTGHSSTPLWRPCVFLLHIIPSLRNTSAAGVCGSNGSHNITLLLVLVGGGLTKMLLFGKNNKIRKHFSRGQQSKGYLSFFCCIYLGTFI